MPKKARATKQRILEAAHALFRRKGFTGTSLEDVLRRASVSKGSFYFHFSSKRALGTATLQRHLAYVRSSLRNAFDGRDWPSGVKIMANDVVGPPGRPNVAATTTAAMGLDAAGRDAEMLDEVAAILHSVEEEVALQLRAHGFSADGARRRAGTIAALVDGHMMRMAMRRDASLRRDMERDIIAAGDPDGLFGRPGAPAKPRKNILKPSIDIVDGRSIMQLPGEIWPPHGEPQDRRQQIVSRAAELFWRRGYRSVSVEDTLAGLSIPKGSFHYYFRSKQALAAEVLRLYGLQWQALIRAAGKAGWRGGVELVFKSAGARDYDRSILACPLGHMGLEFVHGRTRLTDEVARIVRMLEGEAARIFAAGGASKAEAGRLAGTAMALWQGHMVRLTIYRDDRVARELREDLMRL